MSIVDIDRIAASRFALNIADVQEVVRTALGGMRVAQTVEGLERYPINMRYPRDVRNSLEKLRNLPIVTPGGARIPLAEVADMRIEDGPGMIKTENARLNGWIYIDIEGRDLGTYVAEAQQVVQTRSTCRPATPLPGPVSTNTWCAPGNNWLPYYRSRSVLSCCCCTSTSAASPRYSSSWAPCHWH